METLHVIGYIAIGYVVIDVLSSVILFFKYRVLCNGIISEVRKDLTKRLKEDDNELV